MNEVEKGEACLARLDHVNAINPSLPQAASRMEPDSIIASHLIAERQHERRVRRSHRVTLWVTRPELSMTLATRGICPGNEWVAHP